MSIVLSTLYPHKVILLFLSWCEGTTLFFKAHGGKCIDMKLTDEVFDAGPPNHLYNLSNRYTNASVQACQAHERPREGSPIRPKLRPQGVLKKQMVWRQCYMNLMWVKFRPQIFYKFAALLPNLDNSPSHSLGS